MVRKRSTAVESDGCEWSDGTLSRWEMRVRGREIGSEKRARPALPRAAWVVALPVRYGMVWYSLVVHRRKYLRSE